MTDTATTTTRPDPYHYGVFLRPDPLTCATEVRIHTALKQRYGLVSCPIFPPHATLAGNVRIAADETQALAAVEATVKRTQPSPCTTPAWSGWERASSTTSTTCLTAHPTAS